MYSKYLLGTRIDRFFFTIAALFLFQAATVHASEGWLLVDTVGAKLTVMQGQMPVKVFEDIAIGQEGVTRSKVFGDQRTPLGSFRITEIRPSTRYYRFIALDYPGLHDAQNALATGLIDADQYDRIRRAHEQGRQPPSNTPLGGEIGIHGVGNGDPRFHEDYNWTDGCIALTDAQIDELAAHLAPGMTVVIR